MDVKNRSRAYRRAILAGALTAPLLFCLWYIVGIFIYFGTGGSIVGGHDEPTLAREPLIILTALVAVTLNVTIFILAYKHRLKKQNPDLLKVPLPKKVIITSVLIPLIVILAYIGIGWFVSNRSGSLNPYTDDCVKAGAKSAKGDYCVWE